MDILDILLKPPQPFIGLFFHYQISVKENYAQKFYINPCTILHKSMHYLIKYRCRAKTNILQMMEATETPAPK